MTDRRTPDEFERLLGTVLDAEARNRAPDRLLEDVFAQTRPTRQVRRRPWDGVRLPRTPGGVTPLAIAAVLVLGAVAAFAVGGGRPSPEPSPSGPIPTEGPTATPFPSPIAAVCNAGVGMGGTPPALWVACPGSVEPVDVSATPAVVGDKLDGIGVPVTGGAGTWAIAVGGQVVALDPDTGVGQAIDAPGVAVLAVGDTVLWGGTNDDTVLRIDPATSTITGTIPVKAKPLAILEAGGRVWVSADDGLVHAYDAATLEPGVTATVGSDANSIAANDAAVYVVSAGVEGTVTRVDLATGTPTSAVIQEPNDLRSLGVIEAAPDGSAVWVTRRTELIRLDPTTLAQQAGDQLPAYPTSLVLDGASAWVYGEGGRLDRVTLP